MKRSTLAAALLLGAASLLPGRLLAAELPPPAVPETASTRCVTELLRFLQIEPNSESEFAGPGPQKDCDVSMSFDYFENQDSHEMDRRVLIRVSDGGTGSARVYIADQEQHEVNQCSIEGDTLTLDYREHVEDGWGGKTQQITARLERDGRGVSYAKVKSKEGFFGGGSTNQAECRRR